MPCAVTRLSHSLVNAFAVSPHWLSTGNPTGVCLLDTPLEDGALQAIANEVNTSETAFLTPVRAYGSTNATGRPNPNPNPLPCRS